MILGPELLLLLDSDCDSVFIWPRSRGDIESAAQPPIKVSPTRPMPIKWINLLFISDVDPSRYQRIGACGAVQAV